MNTTENPAWPLCCIQNSVWRPVHTWWYKSSHLVIPVSILCLNLGKFSLSNAAKVARCEWVKVTTALGTSGGAGSWKSPQQGWSQEYSRAQKGWFAAQCRETQQGRLSVSKPCTWASKSRQHQSCIKQVFCFQYLPLGAAIVWKFATMGATILDHMEVAMLANRPGKRSENWALVPQGGVPPLCLQ